MTKQPMETAPTDGTRVLVQSTVFAWGTDKHRHRVLNRVDEQWLECRYIDGTWRSVGDRQGIKTITPLAWAPLPGEPNDAK